MSYQVLARKWRPKSFSTLVGQDHVVRALTNALDQERLHHAYLFTGTRGVGKTTLARIIAKSLNCETGITSNPCGVCNICTEIEKGRCIDLIEVDAASNTQVEAMRDLLDNAQYAPTAGRFKVYIIDEVHMLSKSAFNAMLKTLEEPPAHVKFILATTDPQKVPVTVLSRCLQFSLKQMASPTIVAHLQSILEQENIQFEAPALHLITRAAAGSMRDALSLTDQAIAYGNNTVKEDEVRKMLGAIDQNHLITLINALIAHDSNALMEKAKEMDEQSFSFETALNDLAGLLHKIAILQSTPTLLQEDAPEREALVGLADKISAETLQVFYQICILGRRDIGLAPDEYAGFTMTLLRMLAFMPTNGTQTVQAAPPQTEKPKTTPLASSPNSQQAQNKVTQQRAEMPAPTQSPAATAAPAPVAEPVSSENSSTFNGNWEDLTNNHLKLGLARALAQNCEMVSYDEHSFNLRVAEDQKHLVSANYQDKLSAAINNHFGKKITLNFEVGKEANTPAKQISTEKANVQSSAESSILDDKFVKELVSDFDATIIPNSIKPLQ